MERRSSDSSDPWRGDLPLMCVLVSAGGTVHMVCRNKSRAEAAKAEIVERSKNQNVHVHIVDMSNARQVWEFTQSFSESSSVHVLVGL
ncbi:dehydrogenase/reductase SDR family member 12-like [Anarrhichthys ocellatus]|uniref:dehydrogenase/reductase SDR family member 12-like n=1 Tax=Anarrhichthys ocellatus TaxID=433405 RepID=UPI0012EDE011|nr:dehydrogenase/reductase SDR family member 12-like [Anarrhichthys ocellatus]